VSLLIALHAIAATFALMVGGVVISHRPRGDLAHRRLGRVWFAAMYFVVLSSFGIKRLTPGHFSWIHGLSLFTFCTLTLALYGARTHNVGLHRGNVVGSYFGLVGAGIAASAFPVRAVPQLAMHRPFVLAGALAAIALAVAILVRAVTLRGFGRYVRWGQLRGALSGAYDSGGYDSPSDAHSRRGSLGRDVALVPDRRQHGGRGDGARPGDVVGDDADLGAAATR